MRFYQSYKQRNKGFTLIELLVVIGIIGMLSALILASMSTARRKSRDSKRQTDLRSLQLALEGYYDAKGTYINTSGNEQDVAGVLTPLVTDRFIQTVPRDPIATEHYWYKSDGDSYCLGAKLEGTPPLENNSCPSTTQFGDNTINFRVGR